MKTQRSVFSVILALLVCGQVAAADSETREPLTPNQIEELVSPIALYPDPLVALILPAATRPSDIVLAARFLESGGDPELAATEPWDESIKALSRYREVVDYLDENLAWTRSLGECFLDQPVAVMNAIQAVRTRARAAGLLKDTSEQEIVVESDEIRIVPANPTVIYVPRYDPEILYVSSYPAYYPGSFLTFGIGYGIGAWLSYDCDWRYRSIRIAHRPDYWYRQPDWRGRQLHHPAGPTTWRQWAPPTRHDRRFDRPPHNSGLVLHPRRPQGYSRPPPDAMPSIRHRDAGQPGPGQSSIRPESSRGRDFGNQPRNDRISPRRHPSATTDASVARQVPISPAITHRSPPAYQRPLEQAPQRRSHRDSAASPPQEHVNQPPVRSAQVYTPPAAPRMSPPPPERPRPMVEARSAESRSEGRDRSSHGQRAERHEPRRQEN